MRNCSIGLILAEHLFCTLGWESTACIYRILYKRYLGGDGGSRELGNILYLQLRVCLRRGRAGLEFRRQVQFENNCSGKGKESN